MAFLKKAAEKLLGPKKFPAITQDEKLSQWGLNVDSDRKLEARLQVAIQFHGEMRRSPDIDENGIPLKKKRTPEDRMIFWRNQIETINSMLGVISKPFGTAGSTDAYAKLMSGWESVHTLSMLYIEVVADSLREIEVSLKKQESPAMQILLKKEELVDKLEFCLRIWTKKYAAIVYDVSWYEKHVTPAQVTVIQQMQAPGYVSPREPSTAVLGRRGVEPPEKEGGSQQQ